MDSDDESFVYESIISDGAIVIDRRSGCVIANGSHDANIDPGDDVGSPKHKAVSAITLQGPYPAIKRSENRCGVDW